MGIFKQRRARTRAALSRRHGASIIELAVLAPVMAVMVFGTIEIGRKVMVTQTMINAAREGARRATISLGTDAAGRDAVNRYLAAEGITGATTTISPSSDTAISGTSITVTVSVNYANVKWLPGTARFLPNKPLRGVVVMRKQ